MSVKIYQTILKGYNIKTNYTNSLIDPKIFIHIASEIVGMQSIYKYLDLSSNYNTIEKIIIMLENIEN